MKYNSKYGRWFTKGGLVYRYDTKQDKLVLCKQSDAHGYKFCHDSKHLFFYIHRAVYETFVGEIPNGFEIDHINATRDDNRIENLRAVSHAENMNNPLTLNNHTPTSDFGKKYVEHFGYGQKENPKQYDREKHWYRYHKKCRWEAE